ncbi:MAG: alpha/beta fold hydrolase [Deltaproteobacteria bacterium]|nr:alpha/beta fold hydrolase [Deltaproteobacteria bacterium]MBW2446181.1 alpha/beta fold hydrolase [Deltaproteobacteria bacterium]
MPEIEGANGTRIYVEAHGDGAPIVLSCAFCTTHENFRPQVSALVEHGARVILWDYRGHGKSEAPPDDASYAPELVVEDLHRVLEWAAPDEQCVVGGLSLGGMISLHYYFAHADRVRALVLVDSGPGFKNPDAQAKWAAQVDRTAFFLESRGLKAFVDGKAGATTIGRHPELPAAQAARAAIIAQDPLALGRFGKNVSAVARGVIDDLDRVGVPTLIVVGEEDDPYMRAAEVMTGKIPGACRVDIEGAGHICNIEKADEFNRVLTQFLSQLDAETS